jgi:phage tail sheath protein FI
MPEHLYPGVFLQEVPTGMHTIAGVGTQRQYPGVYLQEVPTGMHSIPGVGASSVRVAVHRAAIGARVGAVSAQTYLQFLAQRMKSATAYAINRPSVPGLWSNVVMTLTQLLAIEWRSGHLQGQRQADAYFVRCDRTTMTLADIANGRVVALVGVAIVKPTEFSILRVDIGA